MNGTASEGSPKFSVIIPTYQRPVFLADAIRSVLAQTIEDFECIIVDDASPDPVNPEVSDSRVRCIRRTTNGGQAAAINSGWREARGEFVAFLDDDDAYAPDRLEMAEAGLADAPISIVFSRAMDRNDKPRPRVLDGWVHDIILDATTPNLGATSCRRDLEIAFDESLVASADLDWWIRASKVSPVKTVPVTSHFYRRHGGIRNLNGVSARIATSTLLLDRYASYFEEHPIAAAHRWTRIGLMQRQIGNDAESRRALWKALKLDPKITRLGHLLRAVIHLGRSDSDVDLEAQ